MTSRTYARSGLVVALLCSTAGRAFADGVHFISLGDIVMLVLIGSVLVLLGVTALVLVIRALARMARTASAKHKARDAEPAVPVARVVKDSETSP